MLKYVINCLFVAVLTFGGTNQGNALVGTGGPAPCRAGAPRPKSFFIWSAAESLGVCIGSITLDNSKHPAYEFKFDGIHYASVGLSL